MKNFNKLKIILSSLGELNSIRIWHDGSGWGNDASWFLKFIIIHDLQTREKYYFICNDWLALDKSDGLIDRNLPVASDKQRNEIKYLIEKQTKQNFSDGHLWFSILARPTLSSFTRVDRLTCCFVLLYLTMLMNILYYERDESSTAGSLQIGPLSISPSQVRFNLYKFKIFVNNHVFFNFEKDNHWNYFKFNYILAKFYSSSNV